MFRLGPFISSIFFMCNLSRVFRRGSVHLPQRWTKPCKPRLFLVLGQCTSWGCAQIPLPQTRHVCYTVYHFNNSLLSYDRKRWEHGPRSRHDAVNTRIRADLKQRGDAVLAEAGFSPSEAVRALWKFAVAHEREPKA